MGGLPARLFDGEEHGPRHLPDRIGILRRAARGFLHGARRDHARAGQLLLLGGVTGSEVEDYHDWEIILSKLGWLRYDHLIARTTFTIGSILMIISLVWGGFILYRQFRELRKR